ncbi:hypothetical protein ABTD73_22010, partial [Acinetobacter baumannii]
MRYISLPRVQYCSQIVSRVILATQNDAAQKTLSGGASHAKGCRPVAAHGRIMAGGKNQEQASWP